MELHFQQQQPTKSSAAKPKSKSKSNSGTAGGGRTKFVGVRQRPSGRWVAEIKDTTQKIRMWLGTFETAEEAAMAYDEAACLLRGANTRTNFLPSANESSPLSSRIRNLLQNKKLSRSAKTEKSISGSADSPATAKSSSSGDTRSEGDKEGDDDVYRPTFSNECEEFAWVFDSGIEQLPLFDGGDFDICNGGGGGEELTEFDRMKVERRFSASLYAINGVHEYLEAVHDGAVDPVWDLPPFCSQLYCRST